MKKKEFSELKCGTKFVYKRVLYIKDDIGMEVRLSNGAVSDAPIECDTLVTPVKIKFERVKE